MPHDKNGTLIEKGDYVLVEMLVEDITQSVDYCNVHVKPVIPMPGENAYQGGSWLNTKQVILLGKGPAALEPSIEPSADAEIKEPSTDA